MFSIEHLISTRYPSLYGESKAHIKALRAFLRLMFHESEVRDFEERYSHLQGMDFVEQVLDYFDFTYKVSERDLERIPTHGKVVIVANHPLGSLDALALLKMVHKVRPDVKVIANQTLDSFKALEPLMLNADNNDANSKTGYEHIIEFMKQDGAIIVFPSGEVSKLGPKGIKDGEWHSGFLTIADSVGSPILPIHINARNSLFFYTIQILAKPLSSLWTIHEMFKQDSKSLVFRIGERVEHDVYRQKHLTSRASASLFRKHVYALGSNKKPVFKTQESIAHPEDRKRLRNEIRECELLGETADNKKIYLFEYRPDTSIMREIGRLRELSFRAVGEGTGKRRDLDKYDPYYMHLVLWDEDDLEIVGAYRMCDTDKVLSTAGIDSIYTASLFAYTREMKDYLYRGLELGRSFVQPRYWGKRSLDYLWYGIGALLKKNPKFRYLFGPVSISDSYPAHAKDLLVYFYELYFGTENRPTVALNPYQLSQERRDELATQFCGDDYKKDFTHLKAMLNIHGHTVPTLYKQYSEVCEEGGVMFSDFNIDPDFADCVDGFVIVDTDMLKKKKRERYIGAPADQEPTETLAERAVAN